MTMNFTSLFFYFFASLLICSAVMVVCLRNPVRSALALVLAFIASSGLWLLLEAEFLALILVLVYVGAVMTLFLFVVMTLNLDKDPQKEGFVRYLPYGVLVLLLIAGVVIYTVNQQTFLPAPVVKTAEMSNIQTLGSVLYTQYVYPFELAGVLLLIAIVAAISLDLRIRRGKKQSVRDQLAVDAKRQIRLVK